MAACSLMSTICADSIQALFHNMAAVPTHHALVGTQLIMIGYGERPNQASSA
jgi:hypothetical protein